MIVVLLGLLSFHFLILTEKEEIAFNTLEVPRGQRVTLTLSDGTKVWLNSESKLVYPSGFLADVRKVYLEGEAYFEVTRNQRRPFIVQLPLINVKVLGTTFNVRAYGKEETAVTLATGRVEVSLPEQTDAANPADASHPESRPAKILLSPRQQITYSTGRGFKVADDIDISNLKPWTSGQFFFRDQPLARIAQELERCFDVHISIRDTALASEVFTCHTRPGASLDQILDILKETRRLDYVKKENHILVLTP